MAQQNYANHTRFVKAYHFITAPLLFLGLLGALVNVYLQWAAHYDMLTSILVALLFICVLSTFLLARQFALKAQDRAVRAEESLRYYILTNRPINNAVTMKQIIALRFAPDNEFVTLADRAAKENLSAEEIKKEIRNWRPDDHRA